MMMTVMVMIIVVESADFGAVPRSAWNMVALMVVLTVVVIVAVSYGIKRVNRTMDKQQKAK